MRILHVTPYYRDAWAYGGIPRIAAALAEAQVARGHEVTVWTTDAGSHDRLGSTGRLTSSPAPTTMRGVSVHVFPNVSNSLAYHAQAFLPLGLRSHAARAAGGFDVAHLHACRNVPGVWAASALRRAGVPYVLAPNGTAPNIERFPVAKRAFDALFGRRVLDGAARLVAVSQAERRQLVELGVADQRIRVVGNPIVAAEFPGTPERGRFRAAHGIGGAPLVVFLGELTPRKRVDVLLDAFAMLDAPDARLAIAGNDIGAGAAARERARRRDLDGRVHFTGLLEGAERLGALADADVVVYPGEHEIFGLVALEALLCGTPVVVAGDSGCGEVIAATGGGLVVPPRDARALSAAIREILANRIHWTGAVEGARALVARRFDAPVIAAALEEVYADLSS